MRRVLWLALLAILSHGQAGYSQTLVLPELTPAGKKIVSTIKDLPPGAKVAYKADATGDVAKLNGHQAYWWGAPGWHDAVAVVFVEGDGEPKWLPGRYCVGEAPPPGPVPPAPVKTLAQLAGKHASILGSIYSTLAKDVSEGDFKDVAEFARVHAMLLADLDLTENGAAVEIDKRLAVESLDQLKAALERIVKELGAPPPVTPPTPPGPTDPVTAVVYVYEAREGGIPPAVGAALSELNTATLRATSFEDDTTDATNNVPDQYKAPLAAAREAGLPALVVMAGEKVRQVVKAPTTREQVLEAAK